MISALGASSLHARAQGVESGPEARAEPQCPTLIHLDGPETTPREMLNEQYWQTRWASQFDLDAPILDEQQITRHNASLLTDPRDQVRAQLQLLDPLKPEELTESVNGRLAYMSGLLDEGTYVKRGGGALTPEERARFNPRALTLTDSSFRVALKPTQILCGPFTAELEKPSADRVIDRNACTQIRPQALVQLLESWGDDLWLVRTRLAIGWLPKSTPLSPPIPQEHLKRYVDGPFGHARGEAQPLRDPALTIPRNARVPLLSASADEPSRALIATAQGFAEWTHRGALERAPQSLTRGRFLSYLFTHLNKRYGLGGMHGGIDCSRVNIDTLEPFGFSVPRYSGHQGYMGSWEIKLTPEHNIATREAILDAALKRGVTLLYIPGHMMTYLGRDHLGTPRIFHAFSDYQRPCEGGGETIVDVKIVSVTDLQRGAGSHKRSYLERINRVVVFSGLEPGPELDALKVEVERHGAQRQTPQSP